GYLALARVLDQNGQREAAIDLLEKGRSNAKNNVDLGMALVGTQIAAQALDAAQQTLNEVEVESAEYLARLDSEQRRRLENGLKLLHARLELARGNAASAGEKLKAIFLTFAGDAQKTRSIEWMQATALLAQISGEMGQWDRAAEFWGSLAKAQPTD